uniref:NACHT domain-containing protein n=1 Tax=Amphimedon queenslandica TaxID=400682 RepID=A0A1X7TA43_AMPQE
MIDVSQWRASIGLWNYCQAASSRPANGRHSHSFKAAVDSKSGSTTSGEKTSKLPAALSLVSLLLSLLRYMKLNFISPTGKQTNRDVELNPGPMIDDQQFCFLFAKYLEPLVDWEPFALCLPGGITQLDVDIIKTKGSSYLRMEALYKRWLQVNPTASWRDVINALKQCKENELARTIEDKVTNPKDILRTHSVQLVDSISIDIPRTAYALYAKGLIPQQTKQEMLVPAVDNSTKAANLMNVIEKQLESSLNPEQYLIDICHVLINQQHHTLTDIATSILHQLGQSIPDNVSSHTVLPSPVDDISNTPVTNIRGQSDVAKPISSIPDDVQGYADNMRQHYKHQPIVATDWPPRIGKDFFGRLALVEKQDSRTQAESSWHLLRGQVDKTVKLTENKEISVEDVLQPTNSSLSLRVVIDGPPGIGKTTLCRKLLNMWSNGPLVHQQYDLVLYCPLRNSKIATATTLADLFVRQRYEVPMVAEWFEKRNGEGLLIMFDGWDELSEQLRQSSLAASIICKEKLDQCSVIVTSRSYASSSLLKMDTLSRHVQVIGFSEEEISTVIKQTLQKDTKLAQELIDENTELDEWELSLTSNAKYQSHFSTTQSSKDSQLAVKLINDLKVRNDVQSLCYVPLVCSMVILVYCKEGGHLPTTLTQLYENFILQTIRRRVARHDINPHTLGSLSSLPSQLAKPLQEMCQLAYTNLANTTMTFSSHQLQSLSEAVKEDYLGLMTRFTEYDEEKYQFLHLSIQEFLAAWWIAKHEKKTEEVFKEHFDDDHFRMCLRFVAGLTHLEHESYQQYFNIQQLDLQCKRKPFFGFGTCHFSYFCQNPEIKFTKSSFFYNNHIESDNFNKFPILLLQLLYESQNTTLCQILAQSINNHSLCLKWDRVSLSLFDWLCLSYCINNSNTTWNHLHLDQKDLPNQDLSVFTARLTNNSLQTQCKRLEFLNLPQLKILHLIMNYPTIPTVDNTYYTDKCTELEEYIEINSTLQEIEIGYNGKNQNLITSTIISVIRGVTRNKTITSLRMDVINNAPPPLPDGVIEQLLKDNNTLQALSLNIPDELLPSSLNIVEVNTPLTALEIGWSISELMASSLLPHIKGLHCLVLCDPYPPHLLFLSHPSLHTLTLPLDTAESAIELFTILQTNTTLKALSVEIKEERVYTSSMGTSLQDMLTQNQTLKYLEINNDVPSSFLSFLATGLRHNTSLQQLSVSIPLNEEIRTFINVISQKNNLTELEVNFKPDQSYSDCSEKEKIQIMTPLFYEQGLPAVTNMLQSHITIRLLRIECSDINRESSQPNWIELVQHLYETIFIHPSLEYIESIAGYISPLLVDTLKDQKKTLIDRHRKEQPHKPLLIVNIKMNEMPNINIINIQFIRAL